MTNEQAATLYIQHLQLLNVCPDLHIHSDLTMWLYALDYFTLHTNLKRHGWFRKTWNTKKSDFILQKTQHYFCEKFNISHDVFCNYVQHRYQDSLIPILHIPKIKTRYYLIELLALRYKNEPQKIQLNTNSSLLTGPHYIANTIAQLLQQPCHFNIHAIANTLLSCVQQHHPFTNIIASIIQHPLPYIIIEHPSIIQKQFNNPFLNLSLQPPNSNFSISQFYFTENISDINVNSVYFMVRHNQNVKINREISAIIHQQWLNGVLKEEWIKIFFQQQMLFDIQTATLSDELKKIIHWNDSYDIYNTLDINILFKDVSTTFSPNEIDIQL